MQRIFVLFLCAVITCLAVADEDCTSRHPEEEATLLRKMVLPVVTGGTKCASAKIDTADHAEKVQAHLPNIYAMGAECVASKTGITDPAEKSSMIATCFWNSTKHHRESSGLTDQELIMYDEVWNCVLAGTGGGKA
ncbi:hypothetical protein V5799_013953 [Amblyomma americanum]|uniref:Secreted protein n=1 Tax=Amblyomma americanum TaxID=6943 RepID=A0AAQ4E4M1_AMBAM